MYGATRLKGINASWNVAGIVADDRKLKCCPHDGIVAFCMFPVSCDDERWVEYLDRISREIGITLAPRHHAERVSIPVGNHCNADLVVVAFATPRVSTGLVAPAQEL
jgi:hypothetical protein